MLRIADRTAKPIFVRYFGYDRGGVFVSRGSVIASEATIGFGTRINGPILVKGRGALSFGKYCAVGSGVRIITQNHDMKTIALSLRLQQIAFGKVKVVPGDVVIGNNVWIGDAAILLPGITIGDGAVIGAGSVVTRDVGKYVVVAGNPAREIRSRWHESFQAFERAGFWDQDERSITEAIRHAGESE